MRRQTLVQSVAPARTLVGPTGENEIYTKIENSLIQSYLDGDSYMAKVFGGGMTNARALQVLAKIERKLSGAYTQQPLDIVSDRGRVRWGRRKAAQSQTAGTAID